MKTNIWIISGVVLAMVIAIYLYNQNNRAFQQLQQIEKNQLQISEKNEIKEFKFESEGLKTNTAKTSIILGNILDGGPGKDGIPAIDKPQFFKVGEEKLQLGLDDNIRGIQVVVGGEAKFYPYSIMYWHEIVNDEIAGKKISVTFCPLCGTAIVYDRIVNGEELLFGVSGKLYESNLLMYDNKTHSLWSQSIGESTVGDYLGTKLHLIKSDLVTYKEYKENYSDGLVMSERTGYLRNYAHTPYGSYESDESLYFPIQNSDSRIHMKELLFILPYDGNSYAFVREKLKEVGELKYDIGNETIVIIYKNGEINATIGGKEIPGYIEMFFSWATWHPDSKSLWGLE